MTKMRTVLGTILVGAVPGVSAEQLQQYDFAGLPVDIASVEVASEQTDTAVHDYLDLPVATDTAKRQEVEDKADFHYVY